MKISQLISNLQNFQAAHGDLDVWCFSMDKWGYANNEDDFDVMVRTKKDLYILDSDQDTKILFIGEWE